MGRTRMGRMDGLTDGRTDGRTHGRTDGRTDGQGGDYMLPRNFSGSIKINIQIEQPYTTYLIPFPGIYFIFIIQRIQ